MYNGTTGEGWTRQLLAAPSPSAGRTSLCFDIDVWRQRSAEHRTPGPTVCSIRKRRGVANQVPITALEKRDCKMQERDVGSTSDTHDSPQLLLCRARRSLLVN